MFSAQIMSNIEQELEQAVIARENGLEGRARVSARRAAGQAIEAALKARGVSSIPPSALDRISFVAGSDAFSMEVRQLAEHLLTRVHTDYRLPEQIDLIADTRQLIALLQKWAEEPE